MLEGMSASCVINIESAENVVMIPSAAIQESRGSVFVYTETDSDGNPTGEVEVETGLSNGSYVEITSGLSEGDTVYYTVTESDSSSSSSGGMGGMSGMGGSGGDMPTGGGSSSGGPGGSGGRGGSGGDPSN